MKLQQTVPDSIEHISVKPWSSFTKADYTVEQWHKACLIHMHDGPPTSKSQCKLPVKTPNGALNKNGVFAAAAALAGARGGVHAPPDQLAKAKRALGYIYSNMGAKLPPSLAQDNINVEDVLEHHGVRGMRWGVRRSRSSASSPKVSKKFTSSDFKKTQELRRRKPRQLSNKQLQDINQRMNLEQNFRRMNPNTVTKGHNHVKSLLAIATTGVAAGALAAKFLKTPAGQRLVDKGSIAVGKRSQKLATRLAARTAEKAFPLPTTFV